MIQKTESLSATCKVRKTGASKGITIPAEIVEGLNLHIGDMIEVAVRKVLPAAVFVREDAKR